MARYIPLHWDATLDSGIPRKERSPCVYRAYLPDPLAGRQFRIDAAVAADVSDAEEAIRALDASAVKLANTEAIARLLLRAESVASSHIEGLEIGGRRLLRAQAASELGEQPRDVTAVEVLGNIDAMAWALEAASPDREFTLEDLLETHRRLLAHTPQVAHAGKVREAQNWIGGSNFNPCSAVFVPPPPDRVQPLLADLIAFCNGDSMPAVAQAATAHAQFETIHPFADGNGRVGRALIQVILRRRGLATRVVPPVSLVLATLTSTYMDALRATSYDGPASSQKAHDALNHWLALFASACRRAVADAQSFEARIVGMQETWRTRLGRVRAGSAADLLLGTLPGAPIVTPTAAARMIGRSFQATNEAIARLEAAGILSPITVGRRNRAFEAPEAIAAFTDLERRLASPASDTRTSPPARRVPQRR